MPRIPSSSRLHSPRVKPPGGRRLVAGFTLVELMAVIVIIGILATSLLVVVPGIMNRAEISACQGNLREIQKAFTDLRGQDPSSPPNEGGVALLAYIWQRSDFFEHTMTNAKRLTCPTVGLTSLHEWLGEDGVSLKTDPEQIWGTKSANRTENKDLRERIRQNGSAWSAYRVVDLTQFQPLMWRTILSGHTPLVADGNLGVELHDGGGEPELNHSGVTNVVYGDGTVEELRVDDLPELVDLDGIERYRIVGEDAEHSEGKFKKLVFNPQGQR